MILQSKRVWIGGQFLPFQLEIEDGVISRVLAYGEREADEDWEEKRIVPGFIDVHTTAPTALTQMTQSRRD